VVVEERFDQFIDPRAFRDVDGPGRLLSPAQIEEFNRDGFVVLRGFLDADVVAELRATADRLYADAAGDWIQGAELAEPAVAELLSGDRVQGVIGDLNGPSEILFTFLLRKRREYQLAKAWHQDNVYWDTSDARVMALFFPLTPIHAGNGAISVLAGSHRLGRLYHRPGPHANLICDVSAFRAPQLVELAPGDVMALHSLTLHSSDVNPTPEPRINFGAHFYHRDTRVVRDAHSRKIYGPSDASAT
jgi:phytanoyl-CoA hydroxylase